MSSEECGQSGGRKLSGRKFQQPPWESDDERSGGDDERTFGSDEATTDDIKPQLTTLMPSFTRRAGPSSAAPPAGTLPSPSTSLPLLPSGVPSLDDLLGGGLPLGASLLVLTPDVHSAWGRLLTRYWLAQGLTSGQSCCIVGEEDGSRETVKGCMWVEERSTDGGGSESEGEGAGGEQGEGRGGGKIAWRYEGMSKFRTSTGELTVPVLATMDECE